jgi:hypothetical protein
MIYKAGDENDAANWKPITLISILYRIIFGWISQVMMAFEDRKEKKTVFSLQQKGFVPRINGCEQHAYMANLANNRIMTERKLQYILVLDMRDAFGSVSHRLLEHNLIRMNCP